MAEEMAVPFYCIKVVSDLADEAFFIDFERCIMADGRFNVPRLVMQAMAHPMQGFPELAQAAAAYSRRCKKTG